jgi:hypothetical protein
MKADSMKRASRGAGDFVDLPEILSDEAGGAR